MSVRVCPSAHTGHPWLSISTHISTLVLGISKLGNPVDCLGDVAPRGLSVQYTLDVCGCPPTHIGCMWVSVSTHKTSVAVHQYTYQHVGPWTQHADPSRGLFGCFWPTWAVCSVHTGRPLVSTSTHRTAVAVRVCPCVSECVCVCPSAHTGRMWLSISTHISMLVLGLSTLALPVDSLGYFGPRGMSVQYTQNVRACPSAHT